MSPIKSILLLVILPGSLCYLHVVAMMNQTLAAPNSLRKNLGNLLKLVS